MIIPWLFERNFSSSSILLSSSDPRSLSHLLLRATRSGEYYRRNKKDQTTNGKARLDLLNNSTSELCLQKETLIGSFHLFIAKTSIRSNGSYSSTVEQKTILCISARADFWGVGRSCSISFSL